MTLLTQTAVGTVTGQQTKAPAEAEKGGTAYIAVFAEKRADSDSPITKTVADIPATGRPDPTAEPTPVPTEEPRPTETPAPTAQPTEESAPESAPEAGEMTDSEAGAEESGGMNRALILIPAAAALAVILFAVLRKKRG